MGSDLRMLRCSLPSCDQRVPHFAQKAAEDRFRMTTMRADSQTGHLDMVTSLEHEGSCE
jgi:hypothetical protein